MELDSVTGSGTMDDVITSTIENDEVKLFIIAPIETLKRKNKRCGRDEVFQLVTGSTDNDTVTKTVMGHFQSNACGSILE